jgi:hypothetical protein
MTRVAGGATIGTAVAMGAASGATNGTVLMTGAAMVALGFLPLVFRATGVLLEEGCGAAEVLGTAGAAVDVAAAAAGMRSATS